MKYLCYMPTYAPDTEAVKEQFRPYERQSNEQIAERINREGYMSRVRPWVYMDCIDSILNVRPDMNLVVADAKSTDSIREALWKHREVSQKFQCWLYPEKESQWKVFNDILARQTLVDTKYFIYTSSDIIWTMDWVAEAEKEFEKDPTLQIIFPCVNSGDKDFLPCQVATGPQDLDLIDPPYQDAARAPVLNAYVMMFRIDFFKTYGGYPTIFRNCFTESFLYYMCEAMGGKMRLMPRGWLYHHNGVDAWTGDGGSYHYLAEKPLFDKVMDEVQEARCAERPYMTVGFLKEKLYR